jgi:hypothetical protein
LASPSLPPTSRSPVKPKLQYPLDCKQTNPQCRIRRFRLLLCFGSYGAQFHCQMREVD